jgi:hypothetical protein
VSPQSPVLLLSDDPVALSLLGLLVELANFTPIFASEGERAEDALVRARPLLAVLIDDTLDAAGSDVFFAHAAQQRTPIAIFPGKGSRRELMARIGERGIPYFEIPTRAADLARVIRTAASTTWWKRGTDRRALPAAEHADADAGGLYFVDRAGRRWQVLDRRGGDRRQPIGEGPVTRVFVSDGESLAVELGASEISALSVGDLERQFLQATPGS